MVPTFYINLDRDTKRRAYIEWALDQPDVKPLRIAAIELPLMLRDTMFDERLSSGEIGCYASHSKAWDTLLLSWEPYALVIEDDADVPNRLAEIVAHTLAELPQGWDVVHLYGEPTRAVRPLRSILGGMEIVRYSRVPAGAVAYLISRSGAAKLSRQEKRRWPVDTDLRRPWHFGLDSYGIVPAPFGHAHQFASSILLRGERSRLRRGISFSSPIRNLAGLAWNLRKLGPLWWTRCFSTNCKRRLFKGAVANAKAEVAA